MTDELGLLSVGRLNARDVVSWGDERRGAVRQNALTVGGGLGGLWSRSRSESADDRSKNMGRVPRVSRQATTSIGFSRSLVPYRQKTVRAHHAQRVDLQTAT